MANVASLTASADSKRNEFRLEFDRLMEENRLLKKHSDEARAAVAQREADLESLEADLADTEQRWSDRLLREERARQEAEKRADDHKIVLQRLVSDTTISPTAELLSQIGQDGKSFTQFYAEHALLQEELGKKEQEISRLESALERILGDIKEKVGIYFAIWANVVATILHRARRGLRQGYRARHYAGNRAGKYSATARCPARSQQGPRVSSAKARRGHPLVAGRVRRPLPAGAVACARDRGPRRPQPCERGL